MNNHLNYFDIDSCKYVIEEYKKSTARVVGYQELKTYYSYTLECSFAGYENKFNKVYKKYIYNKYKMIEYFIIEYLF